MMRLRLATSIQAVDSHTMGEPTRIVTGGIYVPGNTMAEKKHYLETEKDELRRALMLEPRGHDDMFGSILTQPTDPAADFGIIFMDGGGYLNMCGHGTIGAATVVLETGMKKPLKEVEEVIFETPAGLVRARAKMNGSSVESVTFQNVPSFVYRKNVIVSLPETGNVSVDIAFGGSFFALVSAESLGLRVEKSNAQKLIDYGIKLRNILNETLEVQHPELEHIKSIDLVEIYDSPTHPDADMKNAVIFGNGQVDRSPCGTGTCAKMAFLHDHKQLKLHTPFVYESILGTMFTGRLTGETMVGEFNAVIPEITGSAYITGFNQYVIDPDDPLKYGFSLRS
jgi:proline racemase